MKEILKAIKSVLLANWPALIGVALLAAILKIQFGFSLILGFILLLVLYFVLGCIIEYILQSYNHYKRTKSGKTAEQLKKEAEIRERRRARGMEMLKDEQEKTYEEESEASSERRPVRRSVSRVDSVSIKSATDYEESRREIKPALFSAEKREKMRSDISRRRTPFDVTPPAENVPEDGTAKDNFTEKSADIKNDETFVDANIISALYEDKEQNGIVDENNQDVTAEADTDSSAYAENAEISEGLSDDVSEEVQTENIPDENKSEREIEEPLTVDEMKQTSEDISREIKERVSAPRKRTHVIFDAYPVDNTEEDNDVFLDDDEKETVSTDSFDNFDKESDDITFDDADDIPMTDAVNVNQDKLDELYEDSSEKSTNKLGFFSKALSGLKKKRNERKNRRNSQN